MTLNINSKFWALVLIAGALLYFSQPRMALRDIDAFHYLIAANSLHQGQGYQDAAGHPIRNWPPGYPFLLSLFPNPFEAAHGINAIAFGFVVGFLFLFALQSGWGDAAALGMCAAFGFGWLRIIASDVRADILNYAFFFFGVWLFARGGRSRLFAYLIWNFCIPLKWVSVFFTPAGLFIDAIQRRGKCLPALFVALVQWDVILTSLLVYNYRAIHRLTGPSLAPPDSGRFFDCLGKVIFTLGRSFISSWYGTIRAPMPGLLFFALLAAGIWAGLSLRPRGNRLYLGLGLAFFGGCAVLFTLIDFGGVIRLLGYGPLLVLLGFCPERDSYRRWLVYGGLAAGVSVINFASVNSLGGNDPSYSSLAQATLHLPQVSGAVYTNAFHLLDVHTGRATEPVTLLDEVPKGGYFLRVKWPNTDEVATLTWPIPEPGRGWQLVGRTATARLYRRSQWSGRELSVVAQASK